jgi:hypothetical protein
MLFPTLSLFLTLSERHNFREPAFWKKSWGKKGQNPFHHALPVAAAQSTS